MGYDYIVEKSNNGATYWKYVMFNVFVPNFETCLYLFRCRIRECSGKGITYAGDPVKCLLIQKHPSS